MSDGLKEELLSRLIEEEIDLDVGDFIGQDGRPI